MVWHRIMTGPIEAYRGQNASSSPTATGQCRTLCRRGNFNLELIAPSTHIFVPTGQPTVKYPMCINLIYSISLGRSFNRVSRKYCRLQKSQIMITLPLSLLSISPASAPMAANHSSPALQCLLGALPEPVGPQMCPGTVIELLQGERRP